MAAFIIFILSLPLTVSAAEPKGTVYLLIQTADGGLIPHASVMMTMVGQFTRFTSDIGSGTKELSLSPGVYKFSVTAAGYESSEIQTVVVEAGKRKSLTFTLAAPAAAGSISGRVTDKKTGAAVGMVEIALMQEHVQIGATITSGADGTFAWGRLPPGTYTVSTGYVALNDVTVDTQTVVVSAGETSTVTLAVVRRSRITAVVTTPDGPVAKGAQLFVVAESDEFWQTGMGHGSAETDTTVSLPPGEYTVTAGGQAYVTSAPQKVTVLPGETAHLSFVVVPLPAGSVRGRLTNTAGAPITNGVLSLYDLNGNDIGKSALTAADGTFVFDPVGVGVFSVHAWAPGYNFEAYVILDATTGKVGTVTVEAGKTSTIDVTLKRQELISVRVVGADGQTVPDGYVLVDGRRVETETGDDGNLLFTADEGDLVITAEAPGYRRSEEQLIHVGAPGDPSALTIRLTRENAGTVKGRATAPGTGGGVTGAAGMQVELRRVGAKSPVVPPVTTGPDGSFAFVDVEPGEYEVIGLGDGVAAGPVRVKVKKGATARPTLKVRSTTP
ncbi:MAG: hypothetical protein K0R39_3289 [Symbiobacteriaceae bacterium]|jgi:hypothetical protein|nr:hypothetical protein [Symbiobacteriaceae bacterium]